MTTKTIQWARQHEHDPNPGVRREAREALRAHYLPTAFVVVFIVVPCRADERAA